LLGYSTQHHLAEFYQQIPLAAFNPRDASRMPDWKHMYARVSWSIQIRDSVDGKRMEVAERGRVRGSRVFLSQPIGEPDGLLQSRDIPTHHRNGTRRAAFDLRIIELESDELSGLVRVLDVLGQLPDKDSNLEPSG
jgi:hypothetical protein